MDTSVGMGSSANCCLFVETTVVYILFNHDHLPSARDSLLNTTQPHTIAFHHTSALCHQLNASITQDVPDLRPSRLGARIPAAGAK